MGGLTTRRVQLSGTGRAGGIAAAALVVTGAADLRLAVWSHQAWQPVLASVLLLVPSLYLAWKALPGQARLPRGRLAAGWSPTDLGVHPVAGGGPLPPYIRRPHDDILDALLDPNVVGSRLVVVRGSSSTGKSRASYEAIARGMVSRWRLEYPLNASALEMLLETGVTARTVLWLGELRHYTDREDGGAAALGRLAQLLESQNRVIALTTIWPEHWRGYMEAARTGDDLGRDPVGTAGSVLSRLPVFDGDHDLGLIDSARGGVVDVPAAFTTREVITATRADKVLADAADAAAQAGHDGRLAQYLAGVPDLLNRFQGPDGDRYGQAIIAAAMDATRLGCESPLPQTLLLAAAPGYLTNQERVREVGVWAAPAMDWATEKLRGAVQAVRPVPPPQGTGTIGYRPADYLDQHGRRTRHNLTGPSELWDALVNQITSVADVTRLGFAAHDFGLYRLASLFWTSAASQGDPYAASFLVWLLRRASPSSASRAALWAAADIDLDDPAGVAGLLDGLHKADAEGAVAALLARGPASQVSLEAPTDVAMLLRTLHEVGHGEGVSELAERAASNVSLTDSAGVAVLLNALREAQASGAAAVLAVRAAAHVRLTDPNGVGHLLNVLREISASSAVAALLARNPAIQVRPIDSLDVATLVIALSKAGDRKAANLLADRAAPSVHLDNLARVNVLLNALRKTEANRAAGVLANRAAAQAGLSSPAAVAFLLDSLREAGATDAMARLADRAAGDIRLDAPRNVASLLDALPDDERTRAEGASLLVRDPSAYVSVDNAGEPTSWMNNLHQFGVRESADGLVTRAGKAGGSSSFAERAQSTVGPGREPDGSPSQPWQWQEPLPRRKKSDL